MPVVPPTTTAVWARLIRASANVTLAIEGELKARKLPPLGWYDALWEIEKSEGGIRPLALQDRLLLPQYGLSRLVERLEKVGLVIRRPCADDGRGHVLQLTAAGREIRSLMWPVYADALNRAVAGRLGQDEALTLARLLEKLSTPEQS